MARESYAVAILLLCGLPTARADVIQLKDKASVSGRILAEKRDHVAVDVGYTVLVIPRKDVVSISKSNAVEPSPKVAPAPPAEAPVESKSGFYSAAGKRQPARNVRDLVNQLGEAVVQVRTPTGRVQGSSSTRRAS